MNLFLFQMVLENPSRPVGLFERAISLRDRINALISLIAISLHLLSRYVLHNSDAISTTPIWIAIATGGLPLLYGLLLQIWKRQFGADFLAGLSIVTATLMGELLVATIIVFMLSGGQALEKYATGRASSALNALTHRTPSIAHRVAASSTSDISISEIRIGDRLVVYLTKCAPLTVRLNPAQEPWMSRF